MITNFSALGRSHMGLGMRSPLHFSTLAIWFNSLRMPIMSIKRWKAVVTAAC
ncbi:hypothetical protein IQ268_26455 [Oculatella sp. LEGE 06141]|uniref:hypothetical protein n=1 Tax=Oculatella sp. LEGE 06141 TaxID=1828648 RepID=UPI0018828171|nr:hypothetical protein [Oculatella sp. LEGE 06141]MBE9182113.1 hypothetical protein [Oculatella sp. LEGE 06141]